jgi:hypothetical protein
MSLCLNLEPIGDTQGRDFAQIAVTDEVDAAVLGRTVPAGPIVAQLSVDSLIAGLYTPVATAVGPINRSVIPFAVNSTGSIWTYYADTRSNSNFDCSLLQSAPFDRENARQVAHWRFSQTKSCFPVSYDLNPTAVNVAASPSGNGVALLATSRNEGNCAQRIDRAWLCVAYPAHGVAYSVAYNVSPTMVRSAQIALTDSGSVSMVFHTTDRGYWVLSENFGRTYRTLDTWKYGAGDSRLRRWVAFAGQTACSGNVREPTDSMLVWSGSQVLDKRIPLRRVVSGATGQVVAGLGPVLCLGCVSWSSLLVLVREDFELVVVAEVAAAHGLGISSGARLAAQAERTMTLAFC